MVSLRDGITVVFRGDTSSLDRSLSRSSRNIKAFSAGAAAALGTIAVASVKMAAQFDRDMRLVGTLTGATAGQLKIMKAEVRGLSAQFGRSFEEMARANYQAVSAGFKDVANSTRLMTAAGKLAVATNSDIAETTTLLAKTLRAFGKGAEDAEQSAGLLFAIIRDGIIDGQQLNRFLKDLPAAANISGVSMQEFSASIALATVTMGSAEKAMDGFRSFLIKTGVEGIQGGVIDRLERLQKIVGGSNNPIQALTKTLGDQNAAIFAAGFLKNWDQLGGLIKGTATAQEALNDAFRQMDSSVVSEVAKLRAEFKGVVVQIGEAITESLRLVEILKFIRDPKGFIQGPNLTRPFGSRGPAATEPVPVNSLLYAAQQALAALPVPPTTRPGLAPDPYRRPPGPPPLFDDSRFVFPFDRPGSYLDYEARRRNRSGLRSAIAGTGGPNLMGMPSASDLEDLDISESIESSAQAMQFASGVALEFGGLLAGPLAEALGLAGDSTTRFVANILSAFAKFGLSTIPGVGPILAGIVPSFATGGYTGSTGGRVHPGEFVMPPEAVRALGIGRMEALRGVGSGGNLSATIHLTQNITGIEGGAVANDTRAGILNALREARRTGLASQYEGTRL